MSSVASGPLQWLGEEQTGDLILEQKVKTTLEAAMGTALQDLAGPDNNPQDVQERVKTEAASNEERLSAVKQQQKEHNESASPSLKEAITGGHPSEQPPPPVESRVSELEQKPVPAVAASQAVDLDSEGDGNDPSVSHTSEGVRGEGVSQTSGSPWRPTLRCDQTTSEPLLCLNAGGHKIQRRESLTEHRSGWFQEVLRQSGRT